MDFNADHFALFGLPRAFRIDAATLDARYRELQAEVHPDRFANAGDADRRRSMQWATKANEAYQALKGRIEAFLALPLETMERAAILEAACKIHEGD